MELHEGPKLPLHMHVGKPELQAKTVVPSYSDTLQATCEMSDVTKGCWIIEWLFVHRDISLEFQPVKYVVPK